MRFLRMIEGKQTSTPGFDSTSNDLFKKKVGISYHGFPAIICAAIFIRIQPYSVSVEPE
jgi:hypothetical protein